jgi:hypothetical protein
LPWESKGETAACTGRFAVARGGTFPECKAGLAKRCMTSVSAKTGPEEPERVPKHLPTWRKTREKIMEKFSF